MPHQILNKVGWMVAKPEFDLEPMLFINLFMKPNKMAIKWHILKIIPTLGARLTGIVIAKNGLTFKALLLGALYLED